MPDKRIMDVTAYTTFDLLDGVVEGHGFTEDALAVLDVSVPEGADHVELSLEMDNSDLSAVEAHADRVSLSPSQARTLAAELESHAADIEADDADV